MALSPKQRRFADEYLVDLNATQAAIRAGYSEKTAKQIGSRLLTNVDIASAITSAQGKLSEKTGITAERVLNELALLGFANMKDYIRIGPDGDPYTSFEGLTRDQAAAIGELTVEDFKDGRGEDARDVRRVRFKMSDKRSALVDIGKHLGMFKEKVEHTGPDGGPIAVTQIVRTIVDPKT